MSVTAGPQGASVNFGARGSSFNAGIPGTGLYSRSRLGGAPSKPVPEPGRVRVGATVKVEDDGTLSFFDEQGQPLSDYLTNVAKRQQGAKIRELLQQTSAKINEETEALASIHCYTPQPDDSPGYSPPPFALPRPDFPPLRAVTLVSRILGKRRQIEAENAMAEKQYESDIASWDAAKAGFDAQQLEESRLFDTRLRTSTEFMHEVFADSLASIVWPRETEVAFQIDQSGRSIAVDIDLPEIEDVQRKTASVPERGYKLVLREIKGKALQTLYAQHVHGVGFRIVGEAFAVLPSIDEVVLSAFTQRTSPTTGHPVDAYIYSVRVKRQDWSQIKFDNLKGLDVVAAFDRFEVRRKFTKNGTLDDIQPFELQ